MRKNASFFSSRRSESGSTLLEILAALLVISILGLGIWNGVAACLRLTTRFHDAALRSSELLRLDDRLRALAQRVRIPYWVPDHLIESADGELHIAYLDGDPSKSMALKFSQGTLIVEGGETSARYSDIASAAFSPAADPAGEVYGLTVSVEEKGGTPVTITARFGSAPLSGRYAP
jgi:hypothetical protein